MRVRKIGGSDPLTSASANCFGFRLDVYDSGGQGERPPPSCLASAAAPAAIPLSTVSRIETMSSSCSKNGRFARGVSMNRGEGRGQASGSRQSRAEEDL